MTSFLRAAPVLLAMLAAGTVQASTKLIVVQDHGGVSALPYYQDLNLVPESGPPPLKGLLSGGAYPVKTPEMTPGAVVGRTINAPGLQPLFLLGDDPMSRAWLTQNLQQLQQLQAVGLVVNVTSAARIEEIRRLAPGLQLEPTPASDIANRLGLKHYPVLITSTIIRQQ